MRLRFGTAFARLQLGDLATLEDLLAELARRWPDAFPELLGERYLVVLQNESGSHVLDPQVPSDRGRQLGQEARVTFAYRFSGGDRPISATRGVDHD